jgi:O-6-methylguanine DNA methyltransferase
MMTQSHDPLAAELAVLAADAPRHLLDRVVAHSVRVEGPIGGLFVAFTDRGVAYVRLAQVVHGDDAEFAASFHGRFDRPLLPADRPPAGLVSALREGRTRGLRYDLRGLTDFEQAVLRAALEIPRGQVRPYAWIAQEIGRPRAVRAVGSALGRNPVPVLIPCHRVVRSDGAVGEYAFGAPVKERLLTAEGVDLGEISHLAHRGIHYLASDTTGVVCFPTCSGARRITPRHRQGFATVAQAVQAGYRPCKHCRPAPAGGG